MGADHKEVGEALPVTSDPRGTIVKSHATVVIAWLLGFMSLVIWLPKDRALRTFTVEIVLPVLRRSMEHQRTASAIG